jgi:hypothetical protein
VILFRGEGFLESLLAAAGCALKFGDLSGQILDGRRFNRLLVGNYSLHFGIDLQRRLAAWAGHVNEWAGHRSYYRS